MAAISSHLDETPASKLIKRKNDFKQGSGQGTIVSNTMLPKQPRFSKGIISIKYKRSPIRLVSPPILKKVTGDSGSQSIVAMAPNTNSSTEKPEAEFQEEEKDHQTAQEEDWNCYFKEPAGKMKAKMKSGGGGSETNLSSVMMQRVEDGDAVSG